ncbi:MAG: hypothetical protein ACF788_09775, partial [Novipirellula sp. JB048]
MSGPSSTPQQHWSNRHYRMIERAFVSVQQPGCGEEVSDHTARHCYLLHSPGGLSLATLKCQIKELTIFPPQRCPIT